MSIDALLEMINGRRSLTERIVHQQNIPGRPARFTDDPVPLQPVMRRMLEASKMDRLYTHQAEAIRAVRDGRHVVVTTGTASGKTLCYMVPVIESILRDRSSRAIFFYPTKALTQDQLRSLKGLAAGDPSFTLRAGVYDGDTPSGSRARIRREANIILTNPDMVHAGILPNHSLLHWQFLFEHLRYVVIDEIHTYRGIFGSHVANVIRRLRRICAYYGSDPLFICCSATIGNPAELATRLIGEEPFAVSEDGSPQAPKTFLFWNPPVAGALERRRGVMAETRLILPRMVKLGLRSIVFIRSRLAAELVAGETREALRRIDRKPSAAGQPGGKPETGDPVTSYRSGYLPGERRRVEQDLAAGRILSVVTTSALELGMDIGGLDVCVLAGYPGSLASAWQRAGRAGRRDAHSLVILIAEDVPADQYLMKHPDFFFERTVENGIIDPDNRLILEAHLRAASAELPLAPGDVDYFQVLDELMPLLIDGGGLHQGQEGFSWIGSDHPAGAINLRSSSQVTYTIREEGSGREVGTVEDSAAFILVHPSAVYIHLGEPYTVLELDTRDHRAVVKAGPVGYHTRAVSEIRIRVLQTMEQRRLAVSRVEARFGRVEVTTRVTHFRKLKTGTFENLGMEPLDLPETILETYAVWTLLPQSARRSLEEERIPFSRVTEGLSYLLEHTLPIYSLCEPADIRAGSMTVLAEASLSEEGVALPHPTPAVVVYDLYPGGVGYSRRGFEVLEGWLQAALDIVEECECTRGCPACVGGESADRHGVALTLRFLLGLDHSIPSENH